ncbi:ras guanine nucleotide exchange factor domain-containing protein [Geranomyces variabilis]|nr:ras guanine nucleotide exchange factor domain-containing protein [Geranomyces variabilis]
MPFARKSIDLGAPGPDFVGANYKEFRVAIVDDNAIVKKILTKSLKKYFHVNVTNDDLFENGLALMQALEFRRYDLIMMDIEMPVLSGWAATKFIRGEHRALPLGSLMKEIKSLSGPSADARQVIGGSASLPRRRAASISASPATRPSPPLSPDAEAATSPSAIGARIIGENRLVPIVAITSVDSPELRASYFAAGMNDILVKPVTPMMVHDILGKYLQTVELSPTRALGNPTTVASAKLSGPLLGSTKCQIYSGTKEVLLQMLLEPKKSGPQYISQFLLTFRSFMEPFELLDWLHSFFKSQENANSSASDLVVNVVLTWVNEQWHDFASNHLLKAMLIELVGKIKEAVGQPQAEQIVTAVDKQIVKWNVRTSQMQGLMDPSNVSRSVQESLISADVSPSMLAEQMCLYDSMLFRHIDAIEYVNLIMKKTSPTLNFLMSRFDKESYWVATEIVGKKDFKTRIRVLRTFIVTAKRFCDYVWLESKSRPAIKKDVGGNATYHGTKPSNLRAYSTLVYLKGISDNKKKVLADLEKFTDVSKNFKTYRDKLEASTPPLIPFLPIFIKDLTFLNDGNESRLANNEINFEKLRLITDCVKGITALAKSEYKWYNFDTDMQEYLTNPPLEMSMAKLQELSKIAEPST